MYLSISIISWRTHIENPENVSTSYFSDVVDGGLDWDFTCPWVTDKVELGIPNEFFLVSEPQYRLLIEFDKNYPIDDFWRDVFVLIVISKPPIVHEEFENDAWATINNLSEC